MTAFQPYLNRRQAESVQVIRRGDAAPSRVNVIVGQLDDNLNSSVLAFMVAGRPDGSECPPYALHLPTTMPSYAAAATLYRLMCGYFMITKSSMIRLRTPNGADEDLLRNAVAWYGSQVQDGVCEISTSVFWQLWRYASEIIPSFPLPYAQATTSINGTDVKHPERPKVSNGVVYSRFLPAFKEHLQLEWENQADQSLTLQAKFVGDEQRDSVTIKLGWAPEESLDFGIESDISVGPYDRVFRIDQSKYDSQRRQIILSSLCHHSFLADARTSSLLCLPLSEEDRTLFSSIGFTPTVQSADSKETASPSQTEHPLHLKREDFWQNCAEISGQCS